MRPLSPGVGGQPEARVSLLLLTGGHCLCPSVEELAGPQAFLGGEGCSRPAANLEAFVGILTVAGGGEDALVLSIPFLSTSLLVGSLTER